MGDFRPNAGGGSKAPDGRKPPRRPEPSLDAVWPDYLSAGYFDESGCLRPELVRRKEVERLAKIMAEDGDPKLNSHQVRRFFQHSRAIEASLKADERSRSATRALAWRCLEAEFRKLDVAAAHAFGRDFTSRKIPRLFHDFIHRNVEAVRGPDDFLRGFLPHFEAFVGFGTQHFPKEPERGRS